VAVYREVHAIIPSHDSKRFTNHREEGERNAGCEFMTLSRIRSATCAPTLSFRFHALTVPYRSRDQIREHFFPIDLFSIKYSQSRARARARMSRQLERFSLIKMPRPDKHLSVPPNSFSCIAIKIAMQARERENRAMHVQHARANVSPRSPPLLGVCSRSRHRV